MRNFYFILSTILLLIPRFSICQEIEYTINPNDTTVYTDTDIEAIFLLGQGETSNERIENFIYQNLNWPDTQDDVIGRVNISGIVEKNGRLTNLKFERKLHPLFDSEAIRIVSKMTNWKPAVKENYLVRSKVTISVKFMLQ